MAVDEAILRARIEDLVPNTLRLYCWMPSTVSMGRFQKIDDVVYVDNCKIHGVSIVRRISGGGTVFHDSEGEVTYSVVASKKDLEGQDAIEVYEKIYGGIAEALNSLGVNADFEEGNMRNCPNLTIGGKKVSGSSQYHKKGVVLQHGTLLLDVDLRKMFTFLRVQLSENCFETMQTAEKKITSLKKELSRKISKKRVEKAMFDGFEKKLGVGFAEGQISSHELKIARQLNEEKYTRDEWNLHGRQNVKII
jgi:lipoate-protein ligase A